MANASGLSHVYVGAAARMRGALSGIFRQSAGSDHWELLRKGLPERMDVQAITIHPTDPNVIFAGSQDGPYRSRDRGDSWEKLSFPDPGLEVWSILIHPRDPRVMYLGTSPVAIYRSDDGGESWRKLPRVTSPGRVQMGFPCRVIRMAIDPSNPDEVYAGLEVDGVLRSRDRGETWEDVGQDLVNLAQRANLKSKIGSDTENEGMLDSHALTVSSALPGTVFLAVRMGLFRSTDRGRTWEDMEIGRFSPLTYARDVQVSPHDARTLVAALSPAARSTDGSLYRSDDLGQSWRRIDHGIKAESTMMAVALHPRDPDQVYSVARQGQVFGTRDGGKSWKEWRLPDTVQDVYAVACG
ncbi:MAG: hypothetical protein DME04_04955 [Candidatus Rokuibacteriota bacterium]|nr:MAG: hypothetical protein DME04_04955 [Candidatus Rokubacteria bacterium]